MALVDPERGQKAWADREDYRIAAEEGTSLLQLAAVVLRRWRSIAVSVLVATVLAAVYLLVRSPGYSASVLLVLPPNDGASPAQMLASQLPAGLMDVAGGGSATNPKLLEAVAKSQSMVDSMVHRIAGASPLPEEEATLRETLAQRTEVRNNGDGSIGIEVTHPDPETAAAIANEFPPLINRLISSIGVETARRKQEFLEGQLGVMRERMDRAERALVDFQRRHGAPEIQAQAQQTVEALSELQQRILLQELRVDQLRRTTTQSHPEYQSAVSQLSALREQLSRLTAEGAPNSVLLPLEASPELKAEYGRLLRDFSREERIYLSLTTSLAEAQLDASRNLPVVSVLDRAKLPRGPSGLGGLQVLLLGIFGGLILGFLVAFGREVAGSSPDDPHAASFREAWEQFKADVGSIRPGRRREADA